MRTARAQGRESLSEDRPDAPEARAARKSVKLHDQACFTVGVLNVGDIEHKDICTDDSNKCRWSVIARAASAEWLTGQNQQNTD